MDKRGFRQQLLSKLAFKFSKYSIVTMVVCVILNMTGYLLAIGLHLPYWLDSIGTMVVSVQFGPLAGLIVGTISTLLLMLYTPLTFLSLLSVVIISFIIGVFFPKERRDDALFVVSLAILTGILTSVVNCAVNFYLGAGMINNWGNALYMYLSNYISNRLTCSFLAEAFIDIPDKVVSSFIVILLVDAEQTIYLKKKRQKWSNITSRMTVFLLLSGLSLALPGNVSRAADSTYELGDHEYDTVFYDSSSGILASEINAVTQTTDGFIWVGTYSGLYIYDGVKFALADIADNIKTVMVLKVDSFGNLWIGTNDSGIFCYDTHTHSLKSYDTSNGLDANSIRAIGEDSIGNIYVGTVLSVSKITPSGSVKTYNNWEGISYAQSFTNIGGGRIAGVTNSGKLFMAKNDEILGVKEFDKENGTIYRCVEYSGTELLVGTNSNYIENFNVDENSFISEGLHKTGKFSFFNAIKYSRENKSYYICCENGLAALNHTTFRATDMSVGGFDGAVSDAYIDNQGNIWFASSKHGIMKYSITPFENITGRANTGNSIVNAVFLDNNTLYVGRDNSLDVIDVSTGTRLNYDFIQEFKNVRIRQISKDSKGNIWISSYGGDGICYINTAKQLVRLDSDVLTKVGTRVRSATELSDGRMLIAGNDGLTFLKNNRFDAKINNENGMNNQYILSVMERDDGSILAASDGDGIYIIRDDTVVGHIGSDEGLDSAVVLRIVKCKKGYLYITSNAVYLDDGNRINMISSFPYSNNYDIQIMDDDTCWVTSSAGLFVVSEDALVNDKIDTYKILNKNWGLNTTFTANSWNTSDDEYLYLCCIDGVRRISTDSYDVSGKDYYLQLKNIEIGGYPAERNSDGIWHIPPYSGRIMFNIAINNYSLSNPLVYYYLEGDGNFYDDGIHCYQSDITPLTFTDLPYGEYKLHIQVIDENTGKIMKEAVERIEKEAMMYEKPYFIIYLFFVLFCAVFYIIWLFVSFNRRTSNIRGMRKEIYTDPMTGILNKAGSTRALKAACKEETGCLLMIDLDSFKLVNDLYGHDMGDRILIRFAELLNEASKEGDIVGRMGGDEFIGFLKNTMDEAEIDEFTKFMNKEIVKSAKEYMGEDMNIPLGTSIGAVRVPTEGTDFDQLFRLADKALYIVKQNGKHGYAFYQKRAEGKDLDAEGKDNNNLSKIKKIIGERNEGKGAYSVNFDRFQVLYKYINRSDKVNESRSGIIRFILKDKNGDNVSDEIRDKFEEHLIVNLKKNDVVSIYSSSFFVLLTKITGDVESDVADRIISKWKEIEGDICTINYEIENVG